LRSKPFRPTGKNNGATMLPHIRLSKKPAFLK
jgi:hypothetical protein